MIGEAGSRFAATRARRSAVSGLGGSLQQNLLLNKLIGGQNPYGTNSQGNPYTVGDGSDDLSSRPTLRIMRAWEGSRSLRKESD